MSFSPVFLFPSRQENRHIHPDGVSRFLRDHRARWDIEDFTVHDLRRTAATLMAEADVDRFIIERCLGHADNTITSVYDKFDYKGKKHEAFEALGRIIDELVAENDI